MYSDETILKVVEYVSGTILAIVFVLAVFCPEVLRGKDKSDET